MHLFAHLEPALAGGSGEARRDACAHDAARTGNEWLVEAVERMILAP